MSAPLFVATLALALISGCVREEQWRETPRFVARELPPEAGVPGLVHCTDATGHRPGTLPFVLGGSCCCTPTETLLTACQRDGYLEGWTIDDLKRTFAEHGITTVHDHRFCNNLCSHGPHLVKGGRCMVPPTPGTLNYEEVLTGTFALTAWDRQQIERHGGAFAPPPLVDGQGGDASPAEGP